MREPEIDDSGTDQSEAQICDNSPTTLNEAASGYSTFKKDKDECIKIVMKPELN
jgi:threonine dehydrogenase-like Zn-dependent dehydrogenase